MRSFLFLTPGVRRQNNRVSFLKEEKLFGTGGEVVFVGEDLSIESITGKDGFIKDSLKFPDGGVVKHTRSHEFHDYEELFFVLGELLLHGREDLAALMDNVRCQGMDFLYEQNRGPFKEAEFFNRVNKIHFD